MAYKENKKLGYEGENFVFTNFLSAAAEWVNEKEEQGRNYDGILNGTKIDIKTTSHETWTFNCKWKEISTYFNSDITYILVFKNSETNKFTVERLIPAKKIIEKYQVFPSHQGDRDTCYIWRNKNKEKEQLKRMNKSNSP
jgi:hypothetical protein